MKLRIIIGAITIILLLGNGIGWKMWWNQRAAKREAVEAAVINHQRSVKFYKNKMGHQVAKARAIEISRNNRLLKLYTDSLQKRFNVKLKQVESSVRAELKGTVVIRHIPLRDTVFIRDTVKVYARRFRYADTWNTLSGLVVNDSLQDVLLEYRVPVDVVVSWERPRLFGFGPRWFTRKQYHGQVTTANPYAKIEGVQVVVSK